ncbi:MAG: YggS family pyridoxal phosphate-dependent enzyme [Candidatus Puniceispirillaceae bacterium]
MMIKQAFDAVLAQIETARQVSPAPAETVRLVAVSKQQPDEKITQALATGHRLFGENRVQEATQRWAHRRASHPDLILHLIGPLQSNKAGEAVALFDVIESVDRPKIAQALAKEMAKQDRHLPCFIQVNTGLEPQKSGIAPAETEAFVTYCRDELGLSVIGLMCIPTADEEAAMHFALMKKLAKNCGLAHLSMGMSSDFETAISFGADYVRVGSALFGERLPRQNHDHS